MILEPLVGELQESWARDDPTIAHRWYWPVYADKGTENTSTVYFEIDPGKRIGAHTHDADETVVVLAGHARGRVGDEAGEVSEGMVVHAPAEVTHDFENTGRETLKLIGFFSKAQVKSTYEAVLMPDETTSSGTP